jgi:hypothetical protein
VCEVAIKKKSRGTFAKMNTKKWTKALILKHNNTSKKLKIPIESFTRRTIKNPIETLTKRNQFHWNDHCNMDKKKIDIIRTVERWNVHLWEPCPELQM